MNKPKPAPKKEEKKEDKKEGEANGQPEGEDKGKSDQVEKDGDVKMDDVPKANGPTPDAMDTSAE